MYKSLLLLASVMLLLACNREQVLPPDLPEEQREFTVTLNGFCAEGEDLRSREKWEKNYEEFETWINNFADSTGFVHNWKGEIKNIELYDAPAYNSTSIGFEIQLPLEANRNISLYYKKLIPYGQEAENLIFHQLRDMEERVTVSFDGILKRDANRNLAFGGEFGIFDKPDYNLCEPHLSIEITSLKPENVRDSETLERAKKLLVQEIKLEQAGLDNSAHPTLFRRKITIQKESLLKDLSAMDLEELRYLAMAFLEFRVTS